MSIESIHWQDPKLGLPDAESNVLLCLKDKVNGQTSTCEGFLDGEDDKGRLMWRDVTADVLYGYAVIAWALMPKGPTQ